MKTSIFSKQKLIRNACLLAAIVLCIATVIIYFSAFNPLGVTFTAYPLEAPIKSCDPYVQQFDAFIKGQLHIDYQPTKSFLALENPYDPAERDGKFFLFDRAYFDGKYYSYFGTAPIFTVMMPCYLLTDTIPSAATLQLVFMLIFALFMTLLVFNVTEKISKKNHPTLLALISYAATLCSLQFMFGRGRTPFYYIAATSAMAFLAAFGYLFVKGLLAKKRYSRMLFFTFAGLAFALCFHSRVNTAFAAAFFIVPAVVFGIILKKRESAAASALPPDAKGFGAFLKKHSALDVSLELVSLALFVVVGFVLAFAYNHARFGNILDFGSKYQLTVADVSTYKLSIAEFGYALFHYFLSPLGTTDAGALNLGYSSVDIGRYLYVDGHFGLLTVPFTWGAFATPFLLFDRSKSRTLRYSAIGAFVGAFVIAWVDFCLGGVIYRYLCDLSLLFAVLAAIGIALIADKALTHSKRIARYTFIGIILLFILISLFIVFKIMAINNVNLLPMMEDSLFYRLFA